MSYVNSIQNNTSHELYIQKDQAIEDKLEQAR